MNRPSSANKWPDFSSSSYQGMPMMTLALTSFYEKDQQIPIVFKPDGEAVDPFLEIKMEKTTNLFMA